MTGVLFDNMTCYLSTRIKGKPFTVTEYNFCAPNRFHHEGGLAMGAYSAFQNVSGIYSFDFNGYNHKTRWNFVTQPGGHLGWFAISVDPVRLLSQRVISLLYLRGDVAAAPESEMKLLTVTPADYKLKEVQEYGYPRTAAKARIPAKFHTLALYTRVAMDAAERVPANSWSLAEMLSEKPLKKFPAGKGTYLPEKGYISSSTGEITVDANISTIRVVTPKSEGFTVTGKSMKGSRLSVTGSTGICSVFASALDGKNLAETSRAVVFHITDIQASGRKISRLGDRQLAYNWGKQNPYLLKKSSVTVSLHNTGKGRLRIHALDINGKVLAEVPFKEENNVVTFTADTGKYASMAYELVREQ